jgi:hypothetical protein
MLDEYESCDVYVDSNDHVLVHRLLSAASSQTEMQNRVGDIEISVAHNDYESGGEGFLDWSTVVECTAIREATPQSVVSAVQAVLNALREAQIRAIPSCYFEDELDF